MDLIYMNSQKEDQGVLKDYTFDLAFGSGENDFECTISRKNHCCAGGYFLYLEGTEYGGIIDDIKSDTDVDEVVYHGRTWHGILNAKCIVPLQPGEKSTFDVSLTTKDGDGNSYVDKYLIVSGEAHKIIGWLIERLGISSLFSVSDSSSSITIKNFQFDRYVMAYDGIVKMLKTAGAKMKVNFQKGNAIISVEKVVDYSKDEQFDSDLIDITVKKYFHPVNHLICLGKGDLDERQVIHLYADKNGTISHVQSLTGIQEVTDVYDYSSAESAEDLETRGIEKMQNAWNQDSMSVDLISDTQSFDIGDIIGAKDQVTDMVGTAEVIKKIVTIKSNETNIEYKVGEE